MFTLDSIVLFFYSSIASNDEAYPSKKRKASHGSISTWVDNVEPNPPPPSQAASLRTGSSSQHPPSLTADSTHSMANSVLTGTIQVTQNTQLANVKECKVPHIQVEDYGAFSDYNETTCQEQDRALTSPLNNGVHATSSVGFKF